LDLGNKGLHSVDHIRIKSGGAIQTGAHDQIKFKTSSSGSVGNGWIEVERPSSNSRRGFVIRGRNTENSLTDLLWHYTNGSDGDAINYAGRVSGDNNIVNKKYVDSKMPQYTITKSNGNYYVQ